MHQFESSLKMSSPHSADTRGLIECGRRSGLTEAARQANQTLSQKRGCRFLKLLIRVKKINSSGKIHKKLHVNIKRGS